MTLYETSLPHKKDTSVTKTLPLPRRGLEPRPESGDKGGGVGQVDMMPASLYHHKLLSPRRLQSVCVSVHACAYVDVHVCAYVRAGHTHHTYIYMY